jgi:acetoin utilization protein AcuA
MKTIVGFAVLDHPSDDERWARIGREVVMELKAVEVLREFRNHGIAGLLLQHLFADPELDQKIIYLTAYEWIWDQDYAGLTPQAYREMLVTIYRRSGFSEYTTNEPNICLRPENLFMVKVGKEVPGDIRERFKWLRFDILI